MKKYFNILVKTMFILTLLMVIITGGIYRATDVRMAYTRVAVGTLIMSLIIAAAIVVFKSEKGKGYINAILGYVIVIPALFVFRFVFGTYLFRRVGYIYILIAFIGIIYGIALWVASRKYQTEVTELNRLLLNKEEDEESEPTEVEKE